MERAGAAAHRDVLLAGLSGRVIEVGAGNGVNFAHYPAEVAGVVAVEPEPYLRDRARDVAAAARVPIEVVDGVAEALPVGTGAFDAGVASLVLCSVGDLRAAVAELHRAIRPGGQLRFLEHVRADSPWLRRVQRVLDATVWPVLNGGCHTSRATLGAIEDAGFRIEQLDRVRLLEVPVPLPTTPVVRGVAFRTENG
jgi:SAM-dependent methyltransferase